MKEYYRKLLLKKEGYIRETIQCGCMHYVKIGAKSRGVNTENFMHLLKCDKPRVTFEEVQKRSHRLNYTNTKEDTDHE